MGQFAIEISEDRGATIVALSGGADLTAADRLDHQLTLLLARKPARVIVDLSRLMGISSICMGSLVRLKRGIDPVASSKRVCLAGPQELVLLALKRARLDEFFPIYGTVEQAVSAA